MGAIKNRSVTKLETGYAQQHEKNASLAARKRTLLIRRLVVFFIMALGVSYFVITTLISQASAIEQIESEHKALQKELAHLQKEETILKEEIVKLNDEEYIAKLARKDYFLSEQGEIIFSIPKETKEKNND